MKQHHLLTQPIPETVSTIRTHKPWQGLLACPRPEMKPPRGGGFTLIELVVVVAVIALGALMMTSALARTRPNVKAVQCLNNLRHWTVAMRIYASDNLEGLPRDGTDHSGIYPGTDGGPHDPTAWFNLLPPLLGEKTLSDYANEPGSNPMAKYPFPGLRGEIWHCPSASMNSADVAMVVGGGAEGFFSYAMNIDLTKMTYSSNFPYPYMPEITAFRKPSATVVFFDCAFNPRTEIVNAAPQYNSVNPANRWRGFSGRHNHSGTIAFLDGQARIFSAYYVTNGASTYEARRPDIIWNAPYRVIYP